jgi:hypothetical protein
MKKKLNKDDKKHGDRLMVVRVTKTEFELSDGRIFPMMFDFADNEVPTVEEFQKQYDQWRSLFGELGLMEKDEQTISKHK